MASTANKGSRAPGRTALSGKAKQTIDAPDGGRVGLAITELSHLGKINLRGGEDILPDVKKHTGCKALPENNRTVTVGERTLVWLAPDEFLVLCEAGEEAGLHSQ
ncbi:MAG: sarcosine oxidase subunit gamma, partial [Pseudomonadota bacterium]|nr:sarcosine oxidase subunit gamma [Pseudomonadota bacterium]